MITSILTAITLFLDPAEGGVCELEEKIIADLESRVDQYEAQNLRFDQLFLDFAITSGMGATSCESVPAGLETHICECLADSGGLGLSACVDAKAGAGGPA